MHCPFCKSAHTGQAGVAMPGLVGWLCLDCRALWWLPILAGNDFDLAAEPAQEPLAA